MVKSMSRPRVRASMAGYEELRPDTDAMDGPTEESERIPRTRSQRERPERVWIINQYAGAPDQASGIRHYSLARALATRGVDVSIFCASYAHGEGVDMRLRPGSAAKTSTIEGVRFVWLRTFPYRGNTWRRIVNMISFAVMLSVADPGRPRPDVVITSSPHPFAALMGWLIAKRRGARYMYEVRDLWPQTFVDLGAMDPRSITARALWAIESFVVRRAEAFITLLPGMASYIRSRGLPTEHLQYLPNGPDLAVFDAAVERPLGEDDGELRRLLERIDGWHRDGHVVFAYTGAHGRVNRLSIVLRAIAGMDPESRSGIRVLFIGDGPEKEALVEEAASLGLDEVSFEESIPNRLLPTLLARIDAGIVHTTATPVYKYGISFNKLFDYMAARLPIVFATETAFDPVAGSGAGLTVPPDDSDALATALMAMVEAGPAERRRMGERGRRYAEREHDMAVLGARFADILGVGSEDDAEPGDPS